MLNSEFIYCELAKTEKKEELIERLKSFGGTFENRVSNDIQWQPLRDLDSRLNQIFDANETKTILTEFMNSFDLKGIYELFVNEIDMYMDYALYSTPVSNFTAGALSSIYLFDGKNIRLSLATVLPANLIVHKRKESQKGKGFTVTGFDTLLTFVTSKKTHIEVYETDPNSELIEGIPTKLFETPTKHLFETGDMLFIPGGKKAMTFIETQGPISYLDLSVKRSRIPAFPQYHAETKELHGLQCSSVNASRIQVMSVALKTMEGDDSIDTLASLLDHNDYHVRWHAVREIFSIHPKYAEPHLRLMAESDLSLQIRDAAKKALDFVKENKNAY